MSDTSEDVTKWLDHLRQSAPEAVDRLVPALYEELRSLARKRLRAERADHTLSTTALVNEAYLKLHQQRQIRAEDRAHFLGVAGNMMRQILVDYARLRRRKKRGGGERPVPLEHVEPFLSDSQAQEMIALDEALSRLEEINPDGAAVVQQRFFAGLTLTESAEVMGVSTKTIQRHWIAARAWLRKEMSVDLGETSLSSP